MKIQTRIKSDLLYVVRVWGRDILVPAVVARLLVLRGGWVVPGRDRGRGVHAVLPGVRPVGGGAMPPLVVHTFMTFKGASWIMAR